MARSLFIRQRSHAPFPGWVTALLTRLEAGVARLFWWLCALLPVTRASALGRRVMRVLGPRMPKQRHVATNLERVVPDADGNERRELARGVWGNFGSVMAEYPHLARLARERVELRFDPGVRELLVPGQPLVIAATHLANWEIIAAQMVQFGLPFTAVYARVQNPWVDRMLDRYRRQLGCTLVEKRESARELVAALRRGEAVGLVADQRVDSGEPVAFFDAPAYTATTPARLALRFDVPLIPVRVERLPAARFRMHFVTPVQRPDEARDDREAAVMMTARYMQLLEDWVRAAPGDWLCTKRRWPKNRRGARG